MELISRPTTAYLLAPSLESLHAESRAWKDELDFWNDEMAFFYKVIHLREPHAGFPTEALADLEKELLEIASGKLGVLTTELENHERALSQVIKSDPAADDEAYRARHHQLLVELNALRNQIRSFKTKVFSFI